MKRFLPKKPLLVLVLNVVLALALLVVSLTLLRSYFYWAPVIEKEQTALIQGALAGRAQRVLGLLSAELDETRRHVELAAQLATQIFSHPESYRLAAQPGEYDFDDSSGVYGSVGDDGASVAFLSAATSLSPEVLRDIRLSEYLNPMFRILHQQRAAYRAISLLTSQSMVRSFPWFSFKKEITAGNLSKDFQVSELAVFQRTRPAKNPEKTAIWSLVTQQLGGGSTKVVCSAPAFAKSSFKGILLIEINLPGITSGIFEKVGSEKQFDILLSDLNQVLGMNRNIQAQLESPFMETYPATLEELLRSAPSSWYQLFSQLSTSSAPFQKVASHYVATHPTTAFPAKLVTFLDEAQVDSFLSSVNASKRSPPSPMLAIAALGASGLFLLNGTWLYWSQTRSQSVEKRLLRSFQSLQRLELAQARVRHWRDEEVLFLQYDKALESLEELLGPLQETALSAEPQAGVVKKALADLRVHSQRTRILSCLKAGEPLEPNCLRLLEVISAAFSASWACLLLDSPGGQSLSGSAFCWGISKERFEGMASTLIQGDMASQVRKTRKTHLANSGEAWVQPLGLSNLLMGPVLEDQELLALVVVADRDGSFTEEDSHHFEVFQQVLTRALSNALYCEDLRKADGLRRVQQAELNRLLEVPLNRIRAEVRTIYTRLGRLTPYYKQHCEAIFFEVGRLYEIAHETVETKP